MKQFWKRAAVAIVSLALLANAGAVILHLDPHALGAALGPQDEDAVRDAPRGRSRFG